MSLRSADWPLNPDRQSWWRRPRMLELAGARLVAYVDTGDIEFECRDLVATIGNGQQPLLAGRRPSGATLRSRLAHRRTVAAGDALRVSGDETPLRGMLLGMNMGACGRKSA